MKVIWGCTGSVATVKVPLGVALLREQGHEVKIVTTEHGDTMLTKGPAQRYTKDLGVWDAMMTKQGGSDPVPILRDSDEWPPGYTVGADPVLHIELRKWADLIIIAPLSANTLAKIANGICDNLLTSIVRCWDVNKPIYLCPAMNTLMWDNPFTAKHLRELDEFSYIKVIPPIAKTLACRDTGVGAMQEVEIIVKVVLDYWKQKQAGE